MIVSSIEIKEKFMNNSIIYVLVDDCNTIYGIFKNIKNAIELKKFLAKNKEVHCTIEHVETDLFQ